MSSNGNFGRVANLVVSKGAGSTAALDLSELSSDSEGLRFRFEITANDVETPNIATIRIYNLSEQTTKQVIEEYSAVTLNAGYENNNAQIFNGTIKQFKRGKERNTDSFLEISAADGDLAYNFATIEQSVAAGATPTQVFDLLAKSMGLPSDGRAPFYLTEHNFPFARGKVFFGLARDYMRALADSNNVRWSIQGGILTLIPVTGYLPGEAVAINSLTGMIGSPEATEQGISITSLLNPLIKVGNAVQLNNDDITATTIKELLFPTYTGQSFVAASTAPDGLYRVIVVEHSGDTRNQEWYTKMICLQIDRSSPPDMSVAPYGIAP